MSLQAVSRTLRRHLTRVETLRELLEEFVQINAERKDLERREKELKELLRQAAIGGGKVTPKGSYVLEEAGFRISNEKRTTAKLAPDAYQRLLEMGIAQDVLAEISEPVINEAALEQAFYAGRITDEQMVQLVERKDSYALMVEPLDDEGLTKRESKLKQNQHA